MIKRVVDLVGSVFALIVFFPVMAVMAVLIFAQDWHNPFYTPWRVGRDGKPFRLFKMRSMVIGADKSKVDTTVKGDPRITRLGHIVRRYKIDELPQFANVLLGSLSLVGPRPNIDREVDLYTAEERRMLSVRPGATDLSSIVFSDLGDILSDAEDANIAYNQLVRPWKSRLALFYIDNRTLWMDIRIMLLTLTAIVSNSAARKGVIEILEAHDADPALIAVVRREEPLRPTPPPGSDSIVTDRDPASSGASGTS